MKILRPKGWGSKNLPYDDLFIAGEMKNFKMEQKRINNYEIICFTERQANTFEKLIPEVKGWTAEWHYNLIDRVYVVKCKKEEKE